MPVNTPDDDEVNGFEEARGGFDQPKLETYETIYRLVLIAYGYRCAMVGEKFQSVSSTLHPSLEVVPIRPREQGGDLKISNYLCLCRDAADAFVRGRIIVADDYSLVIDATVLPHRLVDALLDHLLLPADAIFQPDLAALRFHREWALRK